MLGLLHPTDPSWIERVEGDLVGLLSDHAQCELKAAQTALSLVGRFGGEHPVLVGPLSALAIEETDHFRQVHDRLVARDAHLGLPSSDSYVANLRGAARGGAASRDGIPPLLDRLLVSALVEARSCERFRLLAERLSDFALRNFYRELMVSEARHYRLFSSLAERIFGVTEARRRLVELAAREGAIAGALPLVATVHG